LTETVRGTGTWHCDTEEEYLDLFTDLDNNPDFTFLGTFNLIQDIFEELNYQGFKDEQIEQFTHNRYGTCLEILEYDNQYTAFFGTN
jgi:hypothetical protein